VSTAAAGLFGGFDRWRRAAGGSFVDDDLTQVLDAVFGEGGHAILTHAVDPEAAVFGEHVDRQLVQPIHLHAAAGPRTHNRLPWLGSPQPSGGGRLHGSDRVGTLGAEVFAMSKGLAPT